MFLFKFSENDSNLAKEQHGLDIGSKEPDDVPLLDAIPQTHTVHDHTMEQNNRDANSILSGLSGNELISVSTEVHYQGQGDGLQGHQVYQDQCLPGHQEDHHEGQGHESEVHGGQGHHGHHHHQGHFRTASGGSLSDIIEGSPLNSVEDSQDHTNLLAEIGGPKLNRAHERSPSDGSLRQLTGSGTNPAVQHRTHRRTPSDISLRTLAAIRGTYHKRTASDVSNRSVGAVRIGDHQRSPSDSSMGSPVRDLGTAGAGKPPVGGHQRTGSTGTNSSAGSVLLDAGGPQTNTDNMADDISLLSAGKGSIFVRHSI